MKTLVRVDRSAPGPIPAPVKDLEVRLPDGGVVTSTLTDAGAITRGDVWRCDVREIGRFRDPVFGKLCDGHVLAMLASGDRVVAGVHARRVIALDGGSGAIVWQRDVPLAYPFVVDDGPRVHVVGATHHLVLDATEGAIVAEREITAQLSPLGIFTLGRPALCGRSLIVFDAISGTVAILDVDSSRVVARAECGDSIPAGRPAQLVDGVLFLFGLDRVHAFAVDP